MPVVLKRHVNTAAAFLSAGMTAPIVDNAQHMHSHRCLPPYFMKESFVCYRYNQSTA